MRRPGRPDPVALVAGLGLVAIGVPILLHARGDAELTFGVLAPLLLAALGATLLALGLSRRR